MKQCVRCGKRLDSEQKLRCSKCIERVDEELRGEADRDYRYYFRFNLKRMRHENKMQKMLKADGEER